MKINDKEVEFKEIAYDGCHKIYLIQDEDDKKEAFSCGYDFYDSTQLKELWDKSCPLRFISTWKLERIVNQFEEMEVK